ncbi:MAG: hypothetical protein JXB03_03855 [Spirochaetales bacterium]|nr:hypothetical protein [Spirochaetales bacterium]
MNIQDYSEQEKAFLAGTVKLLVMTHGGITEEELEDLERLTRAISFDDFGNYLEQFEGQVRDMEGYWEMAGKISRPLVQDDILEVLTELSLQEGFSSDTEQKLIDDLRGFWESA